MAYNCFVFNIMLNINLIIQQTEHFGVDSPDLRCLLSLVTKTCGHSCQVDDFPDSANTRMLCFSYINNSNAAKTLVIKLIQAVDRENVSFVNSFVCKH